MKVLIVHNEYGKYSGEEAVVDKMAVMLSARGVEVAQLRMSTAGARESLAGMARGFLHGIYSPSGIRAMRQALRRELPDVVNVHNLYPFISPAALRVCRDEGVPVVMTVHNFRLICPTGLFMRDGGPCELCLERGDEWGCVRHNCEHSMLKSLGYALRNTAARWRGDFKDCVDVFACITDFQRRKLMEYGFDADKIVVIPNSVDVKEMPAGEDKSEYVAFCGRLSQEKGVDLMLEAARQNPGIPFKLAGELRDKEMAADLPPNVELLGYVSGQALSEFYRNAAFVIMASRCYEGFPMAILEAAQYSKPVVGPDHGGFTEIIGKGADAIGRLFTPGDAAGLSAQIRSLWDDPAETGRLGAMANEKLRRQYSTEVVSEKWIELLGRLQAVKRERQQDLIRQAKSLK